MQDDTKLVLDKRIREGIRAEEYESNRHRAVFFFGKQK